MWGGGGGGGEGGGGRRKGRDRIKCRRGEEGWKGELLTLHVLLQSANLAMSTLVKWPIRWKWYGNQTSWYKNQVGMIWESDKLV